MATLYQQMFEVQGANGRLPVHGVNCALVQYINGYFQIEHLKMMANHTGDHPESDADIDIITAKLDAMGEADKRWWVQSWIQICLGTQISTTERPVGGPTEESFRQQLGY